MQGLQLKSILKGRQVCVACNSQGTKLSSPPQKIISELSKFIKGITQNAVAVGLASSMALPSAMTLAEDTFRFPASDNLDVQRAQLSLIESWALASDLFYDASIPSEVWDEYLVDGLTEQFSSESGEEAQKVLDAFLAKLNDPYTRIIPAEQFSQFRTTSDGEMQGVGMMIVGDPDSGKLIVLAPVKGGPADKAGIQAGDEVILIDGQPVAGLTGEKAAQWLRGENGSIVNVTLKHREGTWGPDGEPTETSSTTFREVSLLREAVRVSPVQFTLLQQGRDNVGYIRLSNFGNYAGRDVEQAILKLKAQGAQAFILDLRNNPGGLVNAAMQVAQLWLEPGSTIVNVVDARLQQQIDQGQLASQSPFTFPDLASVVSESVVQPEIPGHLPTHKISLRSGLSVKEPLAVLVDDQSASASEILTAALQDNHRATIIGSKTYGKGKIQSVFPLTDGSGLFLTVAKYETPDFHEIDGIGVQPDCSCGVIPLVKTQSFVDGEPGHVLDGSFETVMDLDNDPCVAKAESLLHFNIKQKQAPGLVAARQ